MNTRSNAEKAALKWLARLNSPLLSEKDEATFLEWLNASLENQRAYIKAEKLWAIGTVVTSEEPETNIKRWIGTNQKWGLATVAAIVLTLTTVFILPSRNYEQSFQTAIGEQKLYSLPDGTTLLLNTSTTVEISYDREQRIAQLSNGEVLFTVSKDQQRPFDVITPNGKVSVVGTQFSVRNQENDSLVTVIEGKVKLIDETLTANQQLSLKQASKGETAISVNASEKLSWRKKELIYRGESLESVIADLNRYYPEEITLGDVELKSKQVIAVLHLADVTTTTNLLARSLGIQANHNRQQETVVYTRAAQ